ncbi:MAG TPA: hypothetical protein VJQ55_07635 [Candidatus Binatia bacterium]|nr:hypothetical protein [Candidatus Binatia bacterium]
MRRELFATMLLASALYASDGAAYMLDKPSPENMSVQTEQPEASAPVVGETDRNELLQLAAIDYCYAGSIVDPTTGESVDLFVFCAEDGLEQNMDLA